MSRITAVDLYANLTWLETQMFVAAFAKRAFATTDPGVNDNVAASPRAFRLVSRRFYFSLDFMTERKRQRPSTCEFEFPSAAEIEISFVKMDVGMANPAVSDSNQNLTAHGDRNLAHGFVKWKSVIGEYPFLHFTHDYP
jgi:hypothetical protein